MKQLTETERLQIALLFVALADGAEDVIVARVLELGMTSATNNPEVLSATLTTTLAVTHQMLIMPSRCCMTGRG